MARVPIDLVRSGLTGRIAELAAMLAPDKGHVKGREYWACNPTRADRSPNSFKVDISGVHAGRWYEFSEGVGGDAIQLIAYCRFAHLGSCKDNRGEAVKAAIAWAKDWLGLEDAGEDFRKRAAADAEKQKARIEEQRKAAEAVAGKKAARARRDWIGAPLSAWESAITRRYLIEVRGIDEKALSHVGGGLKCEPEGPPFPSPPHDAQTGEVYPAMIACMVRLNGGSEGIRAVHRTFLKTDGSGKAPIERAKEVRGAARGCAIRLTKGQSDLSPEAAVRAGVHGEVLAISEGIEDGLTWAMIEPGHRVWAAASLSYLGAVEVPASVGRIVVVGQNDEKDAAKAAFETQVDRLIASSGRPVEVHRPPAEFKDWNDWWRAQ